MRMFTSVGVTSRRTEPIDFDSAGLPSPTPRVRLEEPGTGGAHDGNARGAPCVRLGAMQAWNAGTSEARKGVAPFGRAKAEAVLTGRGCQSTASRSPLIVRCTKLSDPEPSAFIV